ncbi:MAG: citrate synthase [Candidatus Omnitrophica bacterium]|nr:citrate synthase [Candidatus Omnitrophota bacterium]
MSTTSSQSGAGTEVHKGLEGVVAAETSVGDVDGARCQLIYRGYNIDELVGRATYEEVSYLLLEGALPTRAQLNGWMKQLETCRALEPPTLSLLQALPRSAGSMAQLRTAMSCLGLDDSETTDESLDVIRRKAAQAVAVTPTIVAAIARLRSGASPVGPRTGASHAANFLAMLHGREPAPHQARAMDAYFVLLAEHGLNASTFTARTVTGTKSDYFSAITAAIGSLKGPLHGAAGRKAMEMLQEIGAPEHVETYVQKSLVDHKRFMGFGHRVYKGEDPRAKHLKRIAQALGQQANDLRWFTISEQLQAAVWKAKQLAINVDFYAASLLHYLGIPTELFTAMFACARMAGWSAHIIEQASDNRLIRPLANYVGPRGLRFVPLDQRQ